jgi:hypothetical protein
VILIFNPCSNYLNFAATLNDYNLVKLKRKPKSGLALVLSDEVQWDILDACQGNILAFAWLN